MANPPTQGGLQGAKCASKRYAEVMSDTDPPQTFRPSVLLIYLAMSVPTQIVMTAIIGGVARYQYCTIGQEPTQTHCLTVGLSLAGTGLFLIPTAFQYARRHRVQVGKEGLEIYREGKRITIAWNAIETVEEVKFWGWRFLLMHTITGRLATLPVYVANREEYRDAVAHFAGEDHPVAKALAATGFKGGT